MERLKIGICWTILGIAGTLAASAYDEEQTPVGTPKAAITGPAKSEEKPVSSAQIAESKRLASKLAKSFEQLGLNFATMERRAPDRTREQRWEQLAEQVKWAVTILRSISNNAALAQILASHHPTLDAIRILYQELKPLRKRFVVPEEETIHDYERKLATAQKKAARSIEVIEQALPPIAADLQKIMQEYETAQKQALEARLKTQKEAAYHREYSRRYADWY